MTTTVIGTHQLIFTVRYRFTFRILPENKELHNRKKICKTRLAEKLFHPQSRQRLEWTTGEN